MSTQLVYENLALDWSPSGRTDHRFNTIALASIVLMLVCAIILSNMEVAETKRESTEIPERIANLILEQEKQKAIEVPEEKPLPKPEPKPITKPEPESEKKPEERVKKQQKEIERAVTQEQKDARERAQQSGLLALGSELADLMETPSITDSVTSKIKGQNSAGSTSISVDKSVLNKGVNQGSANVSTKKYADTVTSSTGLSAREIMKIDQRLVSNKNLESEVAGTDDSSNRHSRGEEEITLVFDQNKSKLYSIYNRERRKNPTLKGTVVLEIVIAPDGKVLSVKIISSELNLPKLERSLVSRVKQFKFSSGKSKPITITYPIEFLP